MHSTISPDFKLSRSAGKMMAEFARENLKISGDPFHFNGSTFHLSSDRVVQAGKKDVLPGLCFNSRCSSPLILNSSG